MHKIVIDYASNAAAKKGTIIPFLEKKGYSVTHMGRSDLICVDAASELVKTTANSTFDRDILHYAAGIEVPLAANKVKDSYAALDNGSQGLMRK